MPIPEQRAESLGNQGDAQPVALAPAASETLDVPAYAREVNLTVPKTGTGKLRLPAIGDPGIRPGDEIFIRVVAQAADYSDGDVQVEDRDDTIWRTGTALILGGTAPPSGNDTLTAVGDFVLVVKHAYTWGLSQEKTT